MSQNEKDRPTPERAPRSTKGKKRTEAQAALRGVCKIEFPRGEGESPETWYRSMTQPETWFGAAGTRWPTTEGIYERIKKEPCRLYYGRNFSLKREGDLTCYDALCGLVSKLLRKQISYKDFRHEFWSVVERPEDRREGE